MKRSILALLITPIPAIAQVYQPLDVGKIMQQAEQARALHAEGDLAEARAEVLRERVAREEIERREHQEHIASPPTDHLESSNTSDIRFLKFLNQTTACQRVYATEEDRSICIEKLKITDPDFAKTWAEAMTPGIETPELHAHRAELLKTFISSRKPTSPEK